MLIRNEQTICAISTPHGAGGISVVRVSGPQAVAFVKKISKKLKSKNTLQSHRAYFSEISDFDGKKIDEVVITYFAFGKSFTGEEVVEISCHGSRFISKKILDLLVLAGSRIADRGEFTFRAFINGNLDLIQAESVLALIESQNEASAKVALRQLDGVVSEKFEKLISDLTWSLAHIEASIDFAEQGIQVVDPDVLLRKLVGVETGLKALLDSYRAGRLVRDGVRVALVGEPNVGKSSLLNLLLEADRAIVTPIAGTTRDVVEGEVLFSGTKFNFSDTAGLRETEDQVEIIGIDKSKKEAAKADLLCFVLDCTSDNWARALQLAQQIPNSKKLFLLNKSEKIAEGDRQILLARLPSDTPALFTSALNNQSREVIYTAIITAVGSLEFLDEAIISSARQFEQAKYSHEMISISIADLNENVGAEFVAMHLKESLISLQKILGQVYDDQIMDRVFKEFCLGK